MIYGTQIDSTKILIEITGGLFKLKDTDSIYENEFYVYT